MCFGQNTSKRDIETVTLTLEKDTTLDLPQYFRLIQQHTGYLFVYQPGLVDPVRNVKVSKGTYTVAAFLDAAIGLANLMYDESGRNIIVYKKPSLRIVTGRISDAQTGESLAGATVMIVDSDKGMLADKDGKFSIEAEEDNELKFSFPGMISKRISVGAAVSFNVTLDADNLPEYVVVSGYYKIVDGIETGNIESVNSTEISRQPVTNVMQALQGRMAGVYVEQSSGLPGSGMKIQIRGKNSLREEGNDPLYLINGVPYPAHYMSSKLTADQILPNTSSMNGISPAMIESVDILKDADATSIYGSRGANGVVLITTKQNMRSGYHIDAVVNRGVSKVANFIALLDRTQWLKMRNEAFYNDNLQKNEINAPDLLLWDTTRNTDWQRQLIGGMGHFTDATVTVYAGQKDVKLLGSYNLNRQSSVFPGDFGYSRGSGLLSLHCSPKNEKLNIEAAINYNRESNELPSLDLTKQAIRLSPVAPALRTTEQELNWENGTWVNPLSYTRNSFRATTENLLVSTLISYSILPSLIAKVNVGYTDIRRQEVNLNRISSQNPITTQKPLTGTNITSQADLSSWIVEPRIEYSINTHWGNLEMLAGLTFQNSLQKGLTLVAYGYRTDAVIESIPAAPLIESYEPVNSDYKYSAGFTRINYNYHGKYIVNLTARRDASSRYAPGMMANFGAVGAAWLFTNEHFFERNEFLDHGKLRVSYGTTGNDQIGDYAYLDWYSTSPYTYGSQIGIYPTQVGNPTYSWELSKKFETELQLGFWGNRVRIDLCYYRNISTQQLLQRTIPLTTGFESVPFNMPVEVRNNGWEVTLNTLPIISNGVKWTTNINLTFPRTLLVRYDDLETSGDAWRYVEGESVNILKRYKYLGVDSQTGKFLYQDKNGDGNLSEADLQATKTEGVHWYGGIDNVIMYRSFQLSFLIQYVNQTREGMVKQFLVSGSMFSNQPIEVMERWQKNGDKAAYHRFTQSASNSRDYYEGQKNGENAYTSASYLRLRNIEVLFNLPKKLAAKISLDNASLFLRGQNVFTVTNYFGFDPENSNVNVLPPLRTVTIGAKITL